MCKPAIQHFLANKKGARKRNAENRKVEGTRSRVDFFHPPEQARPSSCWILGRKPRLTCNAAVALTYLRHRGLFRVADKLAIVANMCDYAFRLGTAQLEKTQNGLAACVLAISLVNEDFSLLVPQMYRSPGTPALGKHWVTGRFKSVLTAYRTWFPRRR